MELKPTEESEKKHGVKNSHLEEVGNANLNNKNKNAGTENKTLPSEEIEPSKNME